MNRFDEIKGLKKIPISDDSNCFACGSINSCGLQMKFYSDDQSVKSWIKVPNHLCGWDNLIHGGVISTILDETMSWSAIYLLKKIILTKSMTVDFTKPIYVGTELKVEGRVSKRISEREALMEGFIYNDAGMLCAKSRGTYVLFEAKVAKKLNIMSAEALRGFEPILRA
ncbi:MAG: PaaI family thioesterase [Desulfobacterales bacterium]